MTRMNQHARWRRLIVPAMLGALIAAGCGQQSGAGATAAPVTATQAPPAATAAVTPAPAVTVAPAVPATPTVAPSSAPAKPTATPYYRY